VTDREPRGKWDRTVEWFSARNLIVGAVGAAGAPVLSAVLPLTNGWARAGLAAAGVVVALLSFAIPAAKSKVADQRAEESEADAQAAGTTMRVAMSDSLLPALSYVVTGVDPNSDDSYDEVAAEAVAMVLASAARLCEKNGKSRTRACWYELGGIEGGLLLKPKRHFGRGVCPSTSFPRSEPRGAALLRLLIRDKTELWTDLSESKPPDWKATGNETSSYKSFLVVPVRTGATPFGLLMVDSDEPGGLAEEDVPVVQTLGWVLALALSQREVRALPTSPTASHSA
jgi:GAF domain-containing protein